jgi:hypothetical protein
MAKSKQVWVLMTEEQRTFAKTLGNGNLSAGIRACIDVQMDAAAEEAREAGTSDDHGQK